MRTGGAPAAASVVVPAHNEAGVIEECLRALLRDARAGELEVVVACNGCTDDTAWRAESFGADVTVVSTPRRGKANALNLADAACHTFPRVYVDADVLLETPALRRLVAALEPEGAALAASPGLRLDVSRSSAAVRSFYRLWSRLPSVRDDLVGRGVYALSERGHALVAPFPEILADDHHVRSCVPRPARVVVEECSSLVRPPRTLRSLVRRRARVVAGNRQLGTSGPGAGGVLAVLRDDPRRAVDAPVFVLVAVLARLAGARRRPGEPIPWGRDDSRPAPVAE
jgi:glycosyltransferase involved in cell wall biosynthesis